jgi:hypothetical protein
LLLLNVAHEGGCAVFSGGACDCDPEVMTLEEYRRRRAERN